MHGDVEFSNEVVSDPIILRSNGMPVYNYVVVIDDALMKITHVIRGDDHLSNTPKQVALYEALGWPVPEFAHLSTILGQRPRAAFQTARRDFDRQFPRHGCPARSAGELSGAAGMGADRRHPRNFHSRGAEEGIFARTGDACAAVFDMEKLYWLNRHYIKSWPVGNLVALGAWFLSKAGYIELGDAKWLSAESFPVITLDLEMQVWLKG